jgi:hypothetical protein
VDDPSVSHIQVLWSISAGDGANENRRKEKGQATCGEERMLSSHGHSLFSVIYNTLNASNVVTLNTNYGASWLQPTSFLSGRLYEIGGQWSF